MEAKQQTIIERLLRKHEGLRLSLYHCPAGKLTIGFGRNIEQNGISEDEALYLLRNDIDNAEIELTQNLDWFADLDEIRQVVLVDMHFNLGWPRLSRFKNMLAACEQGDYSTAADEMLDSLWAGQVGQRARTLARMMETGVYE